MPVDLRLQSHDFINTSLNYLQTELVDSNDD